MEIKKPKLFEKPKTLKRSIEILIYNLYDTLTEFETTNLYEIATDKKEVYNTLKIYFNQLYDAYIAIYEKPKNIDLTKI